MARWLTFLIERSAPAAMVLVASGISLSGAWIGGGRVQAGRLALVFVGLVLFMVLARLADEVKDYERDRIAHPTRPLPRGLVRPAEARRVMRGLFVVVGGYAAGLGLLAGWPAAALYALAALWLGLMSREFFAGPALASRPLLSAVLHQFVLVPLYGFAVAVCEPQLALAPAGLAYALANLGASMSYEVGRKLDPGAHPVLASYGVRYGARRCAVVITGSVLLAAIGAWWLGAWAVLWPAEALVVLAMAALLVRPAMHRAVERAAALAVVVHVWVIPIRRVAEWLA